LSVLENTLKTIHVIGLGAGVQSSTMALMAARSGDIMLPMPVAAVFADTQAEPPSVYAWLDWLEKRLPFPVYRVTQGSLTDTLTKVRTRKDGTGTYIRQSIPAFVADAKGKTSPLMRGCTRDYKVIPIVRKVKQLIKEHGADHAMQWIGISTDEAHRMKPSGEKKITHIWPLIDAGYSRADCIAWFDRGNYPRPPRSACVFCPYHSNEEWARLKREEPEAFALAVKAERDLQDAIGKTTRPTAQTLPYLHRSRQPIDTVQFEVQPKVADQFGNECEGMCGV
jgi:hypothetical protein